MADIPLLKLLSKKSTFERFRKYIKSHTLLKETEQLLDDIEEYWKMYPSREDVDWDHFAIWHKMVRHPTWEATRYAMYDAQFKRIVEYGEVDTTIVDRFIQLDCTAQIRDICDAIIRGDTTNLGAVAPILDKFTSEIGSAGKSDEDLIVTSNIRSILDDLVSSDVLFNSGLALAFSGKPEKAIPLLEKAIRLNPFAPSIYFMTMNASYRMAGRFDEAVEQAKKAVERNPKDLYAYLALVGGCMLTGRETEARAAAAEVLKIKPAFSVEEAEKTLPYKDKSFVDRSVDAWRKAGLK